MMMGGTFQIAAPIDRVWTALFDIPTMTGWVPGVSGARRIDEKHYEVNVEQRVAFLSARFEAALELQEVEAPHRIRFTLEGKDGRIASSVKVRTTLSLREVDAGRTEIEYENDMSVFGRLGSIGFSVIKRKAKEIEEEFARRANAALGQVSRGGAGATV